MSANRYLFTSESVSMGHPDKVADQISDAILDHCLAADPLSRVACETMVTTDLAIVSGEITTKADLSRSVVDRLVRDTIREIGYVDPKIGFAADTCQVQCHLHSQSRDIACGVDTGGAGDQGMMFGFACNETQTLHAAADLPGPSPGREPCPMRKSGELPFIRPDAKSQVRSNTTRTALFTAFIRSSCPRSTTRARGRARTAGSISPMRPARRSSRSSSCRRLQAENKKLDQGPRADRVDSAGRLAVPPR